MNLPPGSGVQLTPWGFSAIGDASGAQPGEFAPSKVPDAPPVSDPYDGEPDVSGYPGSPSLKPFVAEQRRKQRAAKPATLRPADVLRLARARVREIRAELKRHAALKKELTQLENMLSAAKPLASVSSLDTARRRAI